MIQAADVAVAQHENDRRLVIEIDGPAVGCAGSRHDRNAEISRNR